MRKEEKINANNFYFCSFSLAISYHLYLFDIYFTEKLQESRIYNC